MSTRHRLLTVAATLTAPVLALGLGSAVVPAVAEDESTTLTTALTEEQAADLAFSRDEERMALELWTLFDEVYGHETEVFDNIAESESSHFEAIGDKLEQYDVPDPSEGMDSDEYTDPAIQALYDDWESRGLTSLEEALRVGVELETVDIADLEAKIAKDNPADVETVYTNLCDGSYSHLAAFTETAENYDALEG